MYYDLKLNLQQLALDMMCLLTEVYDRRLLSRFSLPPISLIKSTISIVLHRLNVIVRMIIVTHLSPPTIALITSIVMTNRHPPSVATIDSSS